MGLLAGLTGVIGTGDESGKLRLEMGALTLSLTLTLPSTLFFGDATLAGERSFSGLNTGLGETWGFFDTELFTLGTGFELFVLKLTLLLTVERTGGTGGDADPGEPEDSKILRVCFTRSGGGSSVSSTVMASFFLRSICSSFSSSGVFR